jgi:glycosyltransferase involved in cell wall biosynthesis
VGLVLKTMNTKPNNPEWQAFLKECQTDKRIQLITETLDRPEVLGLINACDAYVSLHRAEGFGRTLAEAMLLGKPVVATNYSGNVDFMHAMLAYPVSHTESLVDIKSYQWVALDDYSVWAESNIESAVNSMQEIRFIRFDEITKELFINEASGLFSVERVSSQLVNSL